MSPELKRQRIKSIVEQSAIAEPNSRVRCAIALLAAFTVGGLLASLV